MQTIKSAWDFLQNQVLGMKWLNRAVGGALEALGWIGQPLGRQPAVFCLRRGKDCRFAVHPDFLISYVQSFFRRSAAKGFWGVLRHRGQRHRGLAGHGDALLLVFLHSLFIGFTSAGLPLGVTFSFLISSPMVDLGSLVLLMSVFGFMCRFVCAGGTGCGCFGRHAD
jgi:hypothetical protein